MQEICHFYINVLCYSYSNINKIDGSNEATQNVYDEFFNRKQSSINASPTLNKGISSIITEDDDLEIFLFDMVN